MKRKFKVISFIMAATLLVSTAAVLAGSTSAQFGAGESSGTARLESFIKELAGATWSYAKAETEPTYASNDRVSTYVAGTTFEGLEEDWGETCAYVDHARLNGANSTHSIDGIARHLYVRTD